MEFKLLTEIQLLSELRLLPVLEVIPVGQTVLMHAADPVQVQVCQGRMSLVFARRFELLQLLPQLLGVFGLQQRLQRILRWQGSAILRSVLEEAAILRHLLENRPFLLSRIRGVPQARRFTRLALSFLARLLHNDINPGDVLRQRIQSALALSITEGDRRSTRLVQWIPWPYQSWGRFLAQADIKVRNRIADFPLSGLLRRLHRQRPDIRLRFRRLFRQSGRLRLRVEFHRGLTSICALSLLALVLDRLRRVEFPLALSCL